MAREYTRDEVRQEFLSHIRGLVRYWQTTETDQDRLEGLAFSILVTLDGCSGGMPAFVVAPAPHPDDKEYHQEQGENWYPEPPEVECDITGGLHEMFHVKQSEEGNHATSTDLQMG